MLKQKFLMHVFHFQKETTDYDGQTKMPQND